MAFCASPASKAAMKSRTLASGVKVEFTKTLMPMIPTINAKATRATVTMTTLLRRLTGFLGGGGTATNSPSATGTVCTESGLIHMEYGYPAVTPFGGNPGILSAAGLTGIFNPTQAQLEAEGYTYTQGGGIATFGVAGSPDPATCLFTYTHPIQANKAADVSGLTISGC